MRSTPDVRFAVTRLSTGPRIHYAEQGDPGGDPIVMLHGWPDSWFSFSRVLPLLSPLLRVVVPDQRGFGDSEKPATGYAISDFADDAVALLDALSIERATVVGHSFGSFVARRVALTSPDRVTRLILIGTAVSALSPVTRDAQKALRDLPNPVPEEFAREFQAGTVFAPVPAPFFERVVVESLKLPAHVWRGALDGLLAYDDAAQLPRITLPTLLMWGEHDALFARADQARLIDTIRGATLKVYPETGHCPNWERPDQIATDLQAFLQRPA